MDLDEVDLMDPDLYRHGPSHELFARLRRERPVHWSAHGFWSVTRERDVAAVSRDFERFSSWEGGVFLNPDQVNPLDVPRNLLLFGCDFVKDIAVPIPLGVLAELIGLPEDDIPTLKRWTDEIEEADGERLTDIEILVFFALLVFAGNDTTRNTASGGMLALLEHPDQWRMLCERPDLIPHAVEEILRCTSVVNYFARTAKHDTELGGRRIRKEDKVVRWYTSASRDEALHEQPDRFDITRNGISHCAFGGGGRHFRLGAGLARLELKVLFEELTRRMPDVRRAGEVQRLGSSWANALTSLPIEFTPGAREADADGTHARTDARESAGAREPRAGHEAVGAGADGAVQEGSRR